MKSCERLKHHLLKYGQESVHQHEQLGIHAQNCDECRRLLQSWARIPELLDELPDHQPGKALLRRTRQAITEKIDEPVEKIRQLPRLATSLASAAVLLAVIGVSRQMFDQENPTIFTPAFKEEYEIAQEYRPETLPELAQSSSEQIDAPRGAEEADFYENDLEEVVVSGNTVGGYAKAAPGEHSALLNSRIDLVLPEEEKNESGAGRKSVSENRPVTEDSRAAGIDEASRDGDRLRLNKKDAELTENLESYALIDTFGDDGKLVADANIFNYYQATESLHFQPAQGYWANTHVPGDPNIRLLRARLAAWDRSGQAEQLEQAVKPVSQPFDAPVDNALALSLMSDANAVEGATRMRLQVGIRGIEHRRGQRPAMNMGVVIDLPTDADDSTRIATRALLDAILASKQPGDHFSLVINGPQGLVVPADEFRFGPLQLARQAILGSASADSAKNLTLADAIDQATRFVRETDDPSQPLGSSSILLVSANTLDNVDALTKQIHAGARDGTTLSVVPLGNQPGSEQVERLVLAGLGNRRILESPDQARQLIEAELHSSSRAVARAARLSIRLAPGVRLIDVVGSERLDLERSQRVRDIENSMDRRLSANLGIQADRGEDEDGIQIVIPSIFSGDDVTVLVDVLVNQPGDIASVSLRYKDLVYSRNGNLRGQLSLPAGALERGVAENAVLKNLLAHHFSEAVGRAADALGQQQISEAASILMGIRDEIATLRSRVPAFNNDPDLQRDQQILDRYINILASPEAHQPELADSLRYAAWAKAHRPLAEWK